MNDKIKENLLDQSCAPTDNLQSNWDRIDWTKAEQAVKKLQARIVKAQKEGRHNKVKALQWTLTHSFYAKALAVKRVTSNGGGCTPGVDKKNGIPLKLKRKQQPNSNAEATSQCR